MQVSYWQDQGVSTGLWRGSENKRPFGESEHYNSRLPRNGGLEEDTHKFQANRERPTEEVVEGFTEEELVEVAFEQYFVHQFYLTSSSSRS